eukprot:TRINITY_DN4636_c0_g1_i1.p1 TRINITY_DN4636_c0_g1~~TRINITY_DN4636_c0_g1_i1.p1  ORF type:complete len:404 (-),score=122.72 TRINITY_DN4636_c0_g1_i1:119-1330(-)
MAMAEAAESSVYELSVVDADGDSIRFVLRDWVLEEWVTGADDGEETCVLESLSKLDINLDTGEVIDEDGNIPFAHDAMHHLATLETFALAAGLGKGLTVHGADRRPQEQRLMITDTDGDEIEFVLSESGVLSESVNGRTDLKNVRKLTIDMATSTVKDEGGVFTLREHPLRAESGACAAVQLRALQQLASAAQVAVRLKNQAVESSTQQQQQQQQHGEDGYEGVLGITPGVAVMMMIELARPQDNDRHELQLLRAVALTHPCWASLSKQDNIWRGLSFWRWPNISTFIGVKDWLVFYRRRHKMLRQGLESNTSDPPSIENCFTTNDSGDAEWEFLCPVAASLLKRTTDREVDFCTVCKSNVYLVKTEEELEEKAAAGECVSFAPNILTSRRRSIKKGRRRAPR